MMDIKLELNLEEVNIVLNALATRPYVEVAQLIGKIQEQGNEQIKEKNYD